MVVFPCGQPDEVLDSISSFVRLADAEGLDCGFSSDDTGEAPASMELGREAGILDLPDDEVPHAILVVSGRAMATGASVAEVGAGVGALWAVGETFNLQVLEEPFIFYQVESSALRMEQLVR